jgi:two-component system LytT family response regulator
VLIVDDEKAARDLLVHYFQTYFPKVKDIQTTDGVFKAIPIIEELNPDVIFLDIQMPTANGMELFSLLKDRNPAIIITTAYENYAIEAIKHSVHDYLLKPIDIQEFIVSVNKIISVKDKADKTVVESDSKRIALHGQKEINYVEESSIKYIISDRAYSTVYLDDNKSYVVTKSLGEFEGILDSKIFFRIHRSHIVNLTKIVKIVKKEGGLVHMNDDKIFKIANQKRNTLISKL